MGTVSSGWSMVRFWAVVAGLLTLLGAVAPVSATDTPTVKVDSAAASEGRLSLTGDIIFVGSKVSGSHECRFSEWTGWFQPVEGKAEGGQVAIRLKTASVVGDFKDPGRWSPKLEKHLRGEHFFDSEKFPEATFFSTSIQANKGTAGGYTHLIEGKLTIKGVEKGIRFPATVRFEEGKVEAAAELKINRKDYNILYDGKADNLIKESVVLRFVLKG